VDISRECTIARESGMSGYIHSCRQWESCDCECHGAPSEDYVAEEQYRSMPNPEHWESRTGRTDLW